MLICGCVMMNSIVTILIKGALKIKEQFETKTYTNAQLWTPNTNRQTIDNIFYF